MSEARQQILQRLRQAGAATTEPLPAADIPVHDWDTEERIRRFSERMQAVRAEIHRCENGEWLPVLEQVCLQKDINNLLYSPATQWSKDIDNASDQLPQLKTYEHEIEAWKEELFCDTDASLTSTLGGIAETGTLVLWPTADEPRLMSLVPPVHIALLEIGKLYTTFAEVVNEQDWASQMPTNALLISGPSKSADIEQTLAYGVHGPKELIVLLV